MAKISDIEVENILKDIAWDILKPYSDLRCPSRAARRRAVTLKIKKTHARLVRLHCRINLKGWKNV